MLAAQYWTVIKVCVTCVYVNETAKLLNAVIFIQLLYMYCNLNEDMGSHSQKSSVKRTCQMEKKKKIVTNHSSQNSAYSH